MISTGQYNAWSFILKLYILLNYSRHLLHLIYPAITIFDHILQTGGPKCNQRAKVWNTSNPVWNECLKKNISLTMYGICHILCTAVYNITKWLIYDTVSFLLFSLIFFLSLPLCSVYGWIDLSISISSFFLLSFFLPSFLARFSSTEKKLVSYLPLFISQTDRQTYILVFIAIRI